MAGETEKRVKNIIIIGASSGIGRALALQYGRNPEIRLGLAARREGELRDAAVRSAAGCEIQTFDLEQRDRAERLDALLARFDRIDLVIYCAGFGELNPQLDWALCRRTLEVNVTGFTEVVNLVYRRLAEQKHGQLAVISSVGGWRGFENDSGYSASKAYMRYYLEGLARKANREKSGVRCVTILPGFVDTAMAKGGPFFWMCSPETAAAQIIAGLRRRKRYLYVTRRWRLVGWLLRLLPYPWFERL